MPDQTTGYRIHVDGIVQGVGFRPFVYNLAVSFGLTGWVRNTSNGVDIEITGRKDEIDSFLDRLHSNPPPLAHIDSISIQPIQVIPYTDFNIVVSNAIPGDFIPVSPDLCICPDCRRELFDPNDRRFRYPFINCTNCGPRFSIIQDIPYDRPLTTMSGFEMCLKCESEYHNPSDRRYHAQPVACAECGPQVSFQETGNTKQAGEIAIQLARDAIKAGKIVAVKGLGGYHLACDASNSKSISTLHERKQRSDKPFALMVFDLDTIRRYAYVNKEEEKQLISPQHPIVLLRKRPDVASLDHTAPNQNVLGFMLPYTPLHLLLLEPAPDYPEVLVMTSGNLSEEPIAYQDGEAFQQLAGLADAFLTHDRPIHMRIDDSVVRIQDQKVYPIRRARGYAPDPIRMSAQLTQVLACGAELKNTFALSRDQYVFISHHIGDLENLETLKSFEEGIQHYQNLFRIDPGHVAVDLHPDHLATRFGEEYSRQRHLPLTRIQHHHAHLAACLADNNIISDDPVIGLIFDGTGYGTDGHIWGGEVLLGNYNGFKRRFHLSETPLPGGDSAIRNPSKIALAQLFSAGIKWGEQLPPVSSYDPETLRLLHKQLATNLNCIPTTSMGRLFDAVASLVGIRHKVNYEGQAAIELENIADPVESGKYDLPISADVIKSTELFPQIIRDLTSGINISCISARFHNTLAQLCIDCCTLIKKESGITRVALSGGVWQNTTLLQKASALLSGSGFTVLLHHRVPPNDGGLALGQVMITNALIKN